MKRMWLAVVGIAVVVAVISIVGAIANDTDDTDSEPAAAASGTGVTRTPLGSADPLNAPGQTLYLWRVTIDPHTKLAEHYHQGTQVARVVSGTLSYDIVKGTATVTRANGKVQHVTGPKAVELQPDDWLIETADLQHFGANNTDEEVVLELASLLELGAPPSTAIGAGATGDALHVTTELTSPDRRLMTAGPNGTKVYGWNHLVGTATVDGQTVGVDLLGAVNYTNGNGPFSGFVTFTFPDGSTLATSMQGATKASSDTKNATFLATMGVIGGTGKYEKMTGTGTFAGTRTAALGSTVAATFDVLLTSVK
jgi:quercetin dioxygenase-like cupin family protein